MNTTKQETPLLPMRDYDDPDDLVGAEVERHERQALGFWRRASIGAGALLGFSLLGNIVQSARPREVRYIRVGGIEGAKPINYNDLDYTPHAGEIRTFLYHWVGYRYELKPETALTNYPKNFYFLSDTITSQLMAQDAQTKRVAMVAAHQYPPSTVDINSVEFQDLNKVRQLNGTVANGAAIIHARVIFNPATQAERTEHHAISLKFIVNPAQVDDSDHKKNPDFAIENPLGLTITFLDDSREKVD